MAGKRVREMSFHAGGQYEILEENAQIVDPKTGKDWHSRTGATLIPQNRMEVSSYKKNDFARLYVFMSRGTEGECLKPPGTG
jgi:hypothetical protein